MEPRTRHQVEPRVSKARLASQFLDRPPGGCFHRDPAAAARFLSPQGTRLVSGVPRKRRGQQLGPRVNVKLEEPGRHGPLSSRFPGLQAPAELRTPVAGARSPARDQSSPWAPDPAERAGAGPPGEGRGRDSRGRARGKRPLRPSPARGCARPWGACALPGGAGSLPAHRCLLRLAPALHPRLAPSLLAGWVLKLDGWQQSGSARGPGSPASRPPDPSESCPHLQAPG